MYIGCHISIAGGLDKSIDRIVEKEGNCLMTFASSPRSLKTTPVKPEIVKKYLQKKQEYKIKSHFFHGVYLVNLASESKSYVKASQESLIFYQQLASEIEAVGTIFHIGSHKGKGLAETINQIVTSINFILDSSPKDTKLIIENAAGQGGTVGSSFDELAEIFARLGDRNKIGFCLDTQHAFASGYPLKTLLDKFDQSIGLKHLSVIHLNDSLTEFASNVDRHANWGEGKISIEDLKVFLNNPKIKNIPLILEVPGEGDGPRKQDIELVKSLLTKN